MNMELHITCIPGDGIGPEIVREAKKVLERIAAVYGHKMVFEDILMGDWWEGLPSMSMACP